MGRIACLVMRVFMCVEFNMPAHQTWEEDARATSPECKVYGNYRDTYRESTAIPRSKQQHNVSEASYNFGAFAVAF